MKKIIINSQYAQNLQELIDYFKALVEAEENGQRPYTSGLVEMELYQHLIENNLLKGTICPEGYVITYDKKEAQSLLDFNFSPNAGDE